MKQAYVLHKTTVTTNSHNNLCNDYHNQKAIIIDTKYVDDFKRMPPNNTPQKVGNHAEYLCKFSHNNQLDTKMLWLPETMFNKTN